MRRLADLHRLRQPLASSASPTGSALAQACALALALGVTSSAAPARAEPARPVEGRLPDAPKPPRVTTEQESPYANALRLARMIHDDKTVARLLVLHGLNRGATEGDLQAVVEAYEIAGTPDLATAFLRERIKRYPDERRTRVLLAEFLVRCGDTRAALAAWREQIAKFGEAALSPTETLKYARDLSRVGDVDAAYKVLVTLRAKAPDDAKEYWLDLATLAWDRDEDEIALAAYEKVYKADPATPHVAARVVALYADLGRVDDATPIALADYARTNDPLLVMAVAHLREQRGEWQKLKELIAAAGAKKGALQEREDWFILEGNCLKQLGEVPAAMSAYRRALGVSPESADAKANLLWTILDRNDVKQLRSALGLFARSSKDEALLWAPFAVGLVKLGRYAESVPYFEKHLEKHPDDSYMRLDYSDALLNLDRRGAANELRRQAVAKLRSDAVRALHARAKTEQDVHVIETTAALVRERSGAAQGEKWLDAIVRVDPRFRKQEDVAVDAYIATDRPDYARRILLRLGEAGRRGPLRRHRLALAIADNDRAEIAALLEGKGDLTPEERVHGLLALDRERPAIGAITEEIARTEPTAESGLRETLARLGPYHRPTARFGGWYTHVTGLDVIGPVVGASHDVGSGALVYSGYGVQMTERAGIIALPDPRYEAEVGVTWRRPSARGVTELGAALNYQEGTPIAKPALFDQRLVTSRFGITTDLRLASRVDDTSFLRVGAMRNLVSVVGRYDAPWWYASLELEGREDMSRKYLHLAWDAVETAEAGVKLTRGEPHVSIGAQGQASQRSNRVDLPSDAEGLILPRVALVRALPPSFQLASAVLHVSRGDFLERYRPDRAPFPRYDCEVAAGVLFPDTDAAVHLKCGASARMPAGYASVVAFYNRGVAGVTNNENAELSLSYAIAF